LKQSNLPKRGVYDTDFCSVIRSSIAKSFLGLNRLNLRQVRLLGNDITLIPSSSSSRTTLLSRISSSVFLAFLGRFFFVLVAIGALSDLDTLIVIDYDGRGLLFLGYRRAWGKVS